MVFPKKDSNAGRDSASDMPKISSSSPAPRARAFLMRRKLAWLTLRPRLLLGRSGSTTFKNFIVIVHFSVSKASPAGQ
eukprot:scaffold461_cov321-Pavlova_lutheri.AAC.43